MKCRAMTRIMHICMVLMVFVSVFFYAPIEVRAEESITVSSVQTLSVDEVMTAEVAEEVGIEASGDLSMNLGYWDNINTTTSAFVLSSGLNADSVYKVDLTVNFKCTPSVLNTGANLRSFYLIIGNTYNVIHSNALSLNSVHSSTVNRTYYLTGDFLMASQVGTVRAVVTCANNLSFVVDFDFNIFIDSITEVSNTATDEYQNGYNAGYSAGEQAGYGNGYSEGFADGEASVNTDAIYDEAYQAGIDSVDTQSYYDAGYQAGYQVAYSEGYESGYDVGYQDAMDRIANWGADTSDYPLEISSGNTNAYFSVHVGSDIPFNYRDSDHWFNSSEYNPNHTYKYVINFSNIDEGLDSDILYDYWDIFLNIGGIEYNITPFKDMSVSVFIPGDRISTSYSFDWVLYNCANYVADDSNLAYLYVDYDFAIYDMGPSGDTQNHIANQTDQLTNGYDSSQGAAVNDDFKASVNEYHTAEDSLFSTATTSLENFTFLDFTSITGMVTSLSFVTSIMTSIYMAMGGDTGASGIILAVLFSVMLVSMAIGLYRYYVSNGKTDGSGKGGD